jgi:protein phosphatase
MLSDRGVFIVADGMGGHAAGEVASEMAVRIISREIGSLRGVTDEQAGERIQRAIVSANEASCLTPRATTPRHHDHRACAAPGRYLVGQVGDSRAYLLRTVLLQLTRTTRRTGGRRTADAGAGAGAPLQQRHHPVRWGRQRRGSRRLLRRPPRRGRPPPRLGRPDRDARGRAAGQDPGRPAGPAGLGGPHARRSQRRGGLDNITAIIVKIEEVS